MGSSLGTLFAVDMGLQWALWAIASVLRTEKFYDLAGSSTFGLLLAMSYPRAHASVRQQVQTAMVATWAARLGVFLFTRVMKQGSDSRFDKAKNSPGQFFVYWSLQGTSSWLWVFLASAHFAHKFCVCYIVSPSAFQNTSTIPLYSSLRVCFNFQWIVLLGDSQVKGKV